MPALASPATWRTHPYAYQRYLFLLEPTVIFAARVNQSEFAYPVAEVTFDTVTTGAFGDIKPGMTVLFGTSAGADDLGRARIRAAATSDTLKIGYSSQGDHDGEVNLSNNQYITVWDDYRVWAKIPRFLEDGTVYKDYDEAIGTNGTAPPPVANAGCGYADFVDTGTSKITVSFDGTNSFAVAQGASISAYLWDVDDGTITVGSTSTSTITATFPAGFRWVSLKVTDSNGKTHTTRVPVFGADTSSNAPITQFDVENHTITAEGTQMIVKIFSDIPESTYPDGTLVIYWEEESYGGTAGSLAGPAGREHVKFIGWHRADRASIRATRTGILSGISFTCMGVAGILQNTPGLEQVLEYNNAADIWMEMAYLNIDRYIWYLLYWHSTALEVAAFTWSGQGSTYPVTGLESQGMNLFEQVNQMAQAIGYRLACDQRGRLFVNPHPLLLNSGSRTSTTIISLVSTDWTDINIARIRPPRIYWLQGSAIIASATDISAVLCLAPGESPGQGMGPDQMGQQLVVNQTELNARTGHAYAMRNSPYDPLEITLINTGDAGIEPAFFEWIKLTLSADTNERGYAFTEQRMLPEHVTIQHSNDQKMIKEVVVRALVETVGTPAATVVVPLDTTVPPYTPPGEVYPPSTETNYGIHQGVGVMGMFTRDGYLVTTEDFSTPEANGGPTWTATALGLTGNIDAFVVDPFSYIDGGGVDGWIVTESRIYKIDDIFEDYGARVTTQQHVFSVGGGTTSAIDASFSVQNWVMVAKFVSSGGGVIVSYTTNGGSTWTEVTVSALYSTATSGHGWSMGSLLTGLHLSSKTPGLAYVTAYSTGGASPQASFYKSLNYGASWAAIDKADIDPGEGLSPTIDQPWDYPSDGLVYHGYLEHGASDFFKIRRTLIGSSPSDITPTISGTFYGLRYATADWGMNVMAEDRQNIVLCGQNYEDDEFATFISNDAGQTWRTLETGVSAGETYLRAVFAGDKDVLYFWMGDNIIGYTQDGGASIDNRKGNWADLGIGSAYPEPRMIVGGLS